MFKYLNIKEIRLVLTVLRYFHITLRFNFRYLPLRQAVKLPFVFECGARFYALKGSVKIDCDVKPAMVRFKSRNVGVYDPNMKFIFENYGQFVIEGPGVFKAGSAVSIGPNGKFVLGSNFAIGPLNKIVCLDSVKIGANSLFAWEVILLDSDFHNVLDLNTEKVRKNTSPIEIGDNCWIGTRAIIYKGTIIPSNTIVAGMSVLNKEYVIEEYSLLAGIPAMVKAEKITRLLNDSVSLDEIHLKIDEFKKNYNSK